MFNRSNWLTKNDLVNSHHGRRNMAKLVLSCFVLGSALKFSVDICDVNTISDSNGSHEIPFNSLTIDHLKKMIYCERQGSFGQIDPSMLVLWKVSIPTREKNGKYAKLKKDPRLEIVKKELEVEELEECWDVDTSFSDIRKEHIHIIIQPPPPATTGKRPLENSDEENESQAKKGKLMDQELIRDLIFKDLENIDTSKPNFTLPPLPRSARSTIYNRKCYKYFLDFILNDDGNSYCRYYISGNPGIGKTYFGRLMLIELLKRGKKVLVDYRGFTALIDPTAPKNYLQEVKDEYVFGQIAQQKDIWCIIDGVAPKVGHDFDGGKLILVSSPRKEIVAGFMKHQNHKKFVMPTWKEEEIDECWRQLHENKTNVTLGSLKEKFKLCGGIARWVFDTKMTLEDIKNNIKSAVTSIDAKILNFQGQEVRGEELTHRLIHIHTNCPLANNEDPNPYTISICYFASEQITNLCLEKLKKDDNEQLRKFMENAKDISEMGSLRGQLFEMICHVILRSGKDFRVRNLLDGREEIKNFGVLEEEFYDKVTEINVNGNYYRPYSKTCKSVDSYIHYNQLFQITVAKRHGIKQKGIKNFENILNKSNEIKLYFAVPKDFFESFTKQNYMDGDKKAVTVENWINEIKQYSLCVDLDQFLISD